MSPQALAGKHVAFAAVLHIITPGAKHICNSVLQIFHFLRRDQGAFGASCHLLPPCGSRSLCLEPQVARRRQAPCQHAG